MRALPIVAVLFAPAAAEAHLGLETPVGRYGANVLKFGPCGQAGGTRSQNVNTFEPGATIEVRWVEYVNHPGHFRVAFDADGDDDFVDPPCLADCNSTSPMIELYSNASVLMDGIADGTNSVMVTLPDVECSNCTLQAIQVMYDKPPYVIPGNDIYYQCADLVLARAQPGIDAGAGSDAAVGPDSGIRADAGVVASDSGADPMEPDSGCVCVGRTDLGPNPPLLLFALVLALRRRR